MTIAVAMPAMLCGAIVAWLGLDQLLLWRFVDFAPAWLYLAGLAGIGAATWLAARLACRLTAPPAGLVPLGVSVTAAFLLLLLGGEGRLFYANIDWQVRDAILRDMILHPWPFAYTARGVPELLRAPLGMYLAPALAGKALGAGAADWALLVQNSLLLGAALALASLRFVGGRARWAALAIFLGFSGMDVVGQRLVDWGSGRALPGHLETWAQLQYSSHVTQAFWVPQHALAGWLLAMLFLLWKDRELPVGLLIGALPLTALWSPLAAIGALPFAAFAGWRTLVDRALAWDDVAFAAVATAVAAPGLLYLASAADSVGLRFLAVPIGRWFLFELIETLPYLAGVAAIGVAGRYGRATLAVTAATLLALPFLQVGDSIDLMMRASIPALAILSVLVADAVATAASATTERRVWGAALGVVLAAGSVTGLSELRRAFVYRPAPRALCAFPDAWDQSFAGWSKSTYLAPVTAMPAAIRPTAPALLPPDPPARCWSRPWSMPIAR